MLWSAGKIVALPPVLQQRSLLPQNASDRRKIASERGASQDPAANHALNSASQHSLQMLQLVDWYSLQMVQFTDGTAGSFCRWYSWHRRYSLQMVHMVLVVLFCEPLNPGPSISARPASVIARRGFLSRSSKRRRRGIIGRCMRVLRMRR